MATCLLEPTVDELTRRRLLGTGAGLGLGLALTACGRGTDTAPVVTATGYPLTVRHEVGETTFDRPPARIVSVTDGAELGALLALGLTPVAFGQRNDPLLPWIEQAGAADPAIERFDLPTAEVNFELLATLAPDVIIGQYGFVTEDNVTTFQGVAPTVATSFIDWRESLRQVAEATGTQDRARQLEADLDAQVDDAASRLTGMSGTRVAIFSVYEGNESYALNDASPAGEILARLGTAPLLGQRTDAEAAELVSAELAGAELECDVALIQIYGDDRAGFDAARDAGIFDSITAFRAGRVVELSDVDSQALYFSSVLTVPWNLDVLERVLST